MNPLTIPLPPTENPSLAVRDETKRLIALWRLQRALAHRPDAERVAELAEAVQLATPELHRLAIAKSFCVKRIKRREGE